MFRYFVSHILEQNSCEAKKMLSLNKILSLKGKKLDKNVIQNMYYEEKYIKNIIQDV